MSGNQAHFDVLTAHARQARLLDGSRERDGDYRGRILAAVVAANGGSHTPLVDQIVDYQCTTPGKTAFQTRVGVKVGKGCKPRRNARYQATYWAREVNRGSVVDIVLRERSAGRRVPSVPAIHRELKSEGWKVGPTGIRTALRSIEGGQPPIITKARAGLAATSRDLLKVFEADLPKGSVVVVDWSDCLRKLYAPSTNRSTQRSQKARLDAAIRELETTKNLGMSIRRDGRMIFVGRGRAIPANLYSFVRENPIRTIKLSPGIAFGRAGLWSTEEGLMARSLVESVLDEPYVDENLACLLGQRSERELDKIENRADQIRYTAQRAFTTMSKPLMREARTMLEDVGEGRKANRDALEAIQEIVARETGFVALWAAARTWKGLESRTSTLSMTRIKTLGKRFAELQEATDTRFAFDTILWRDTPKLLRGDAPKAPAPVEIQPAPVAYVPTEEELERRRDVRRRVEAMKAEREAENARFMERRARMIAAGIIQEWAPTDLSKATIGGVTGWSN